IAHREFMVGNAHPTGLWLIFGSPLKVPSKTAAFLEDGLPGPSPFTVTGLGSPSFSYGRLSFCQAL
ncbi:MAG TPA: hypothetical protein VF278_21505, partial [Pirellulales bacterium]